MKRTDGDNYLAIAFVATTEPIRKFSNAFPVLPLQRQFVQGQWASPPAFEAAHQSAF